MNSNKPQRYDSYKWMGIFLGILAAATLFIQILRSESATKTETTLFGILQFVFSIGFAWILSRASFRREFEEGQRRFAIAAYRRIREIERKTERLLMRTSYKIKNISSDLAHEVDVIQQIAIGIQDAVKSSISDWADIIGEEIATVEKIEEIKTERAGLLAASDNIQPEAVIEDENERIDVATRLDALNNELSKLKESLPASLQVLEATQPVESGFRSTLRELKKQIQERDILELTGAWIPDLGFEKSITEQSLGDRLTFTIGDVGERTAIYVAYNDSGNSVGQLINTFIPRATYGEFMKAVSRVVGQTKFEAELVAMKYDPDMNRWSFTVKAVPVKQHQDFKQ